MGRIIYRIFIDQLYQATQPPIASGHSIVIIPRTQALPTVLLFALFAQKCCLSRPSLYERM